VLAEPYSFWGAVGEANHVVFPSQSVSLIRIIGQYILHCSSRIDVPITDMITKLHT
jgi:hypothetical protein